ncbi:MAG: hypothetical protein OXH57_12385 [Ekhidna sp.]|nr:hypothetical protein [Ekhidna sp.]
MIKVWKQRNFNGFIRQHYFVFGYGIVNWLLTITYLAWIIKYLGLNFLWYFPIKVYHAIRNLLVKLDVSFAMDLFSFSNLLAIGLYLTLLKTVILIVRIKLRNAKPGLI